MLGNNVQNPNMPLTSQREYQGQAMGFQTQMQPKMSQKTVLIQQVPEGFKLVYSYGQNDAGNYNDTVKTLQEVFAKIQMFLAEGAQQGI